MARFKYLIVKDEEDNPLPVIFPVNAEHVDIQESLKLEAISAAFLRINLDEQGELVFYCFGASESLGLVHRVEDSDLIKAFYEAGAPGDF